MVSSFDLLKVRNERCVGGGLWKKEKPEVLFRSKDKFGSFWVGPQGVDMDERIVSTVLHEPHRVFYINGCSLPKPSCHFNYKEPTAHSGPP